MAGDRYVVLGLAHPRSGWFRTLAQWTNAASLPAELVKCLSIEDLRARLRSDRPHSAVVIDGRIPGVDRDLVALAHRAGCRVVVVDDRRSQAEWETIGIDATLSSTFDRADLLGGLAGAPLIGRADEVPVVLDPAKPPAWRAPLTMVCGAGGTGTSTVAMALAQTLGGDVRNGGMVVLADLARHADQALLHGAGDVVPGVQELTESHRRGNLAPEEVRAFTYTVGGRGYDLLLGLRRGRDWVAIRPRAFEAALAGLRGAYRVVVCDCDADLEGEADTGSIDVEERNTMCRAAADAADAVFAVGHPGVKGLHSLVGVIGDLLAFGVAAPVIVPVVNRAPRGQRSRAELAAALRDLLPPHDEPGRVVWLPERNVDAAARDQVRLPGALADPLGQAWRAAMEAARRRRDDHPVGVSEPELVAPGSLGTTPDDNQATG